MKYVHQPRIGPEENGSELLIGQRSLQLVNPIQQLDHLHQCPGIVNQEVGQRIIAQLPADIKYSGSTSWLAVMQQILMIGHPWNPRRDNIIWCQSPEQIVPQLPERAQNVPCPVGIVTIQGIPSADVRPSEPRIDLLQKSDAARCFQLCFGDKLNFRFGLVLIPVVPGEKGLEREAGGVDLTSGPRQNESRQPRDVRDFP